MCYSDWPSVETGSLDTLLGIAVAAGSAGGQGDAVHADGRLYVRDVSQAALDAALAAFDPTDALKRELKAHAARRRWQIEIGGIVIGGVAIATDIESQGKILGAYVAASRDPNWQTLWDSIHPISAPTMLAIGDAVQAHINASFLTRATIWADIDAGTITTTAEIDAAFEA